MVDLSVAQPGDRVRIVSDLESVRNNSATFDKKIFQGVEFQIKSIESYSGFSIKSSQPYRVTLEDEDVFYWFAEELEYVYQNDDFSINDSDIGALLEVM